ncbi:MAG: hypothetical protein QOG63_1993 [Thermoleophilaceae bacterium]|nr:hypothetical protein [Thermoleophilaceae bacterium]
MATFDQLPAEQRAIIELVVARGRSYEALADVLQVPEQRVRQLAREALVELSPVTAARVDESWRGEVADYLLGQQAGGEAEATETELSRSEPARTWALSLLDALDTLFGETVRPSIPEPGLAAVGTEREPGRAREPSDADEREETRPRERVRSGVMDAETRIRERQRTTAPERKPDRDRDRDEAEDERKPIAAGTTLSPAAQSALRRRRITAAVAGLVAVIALGLGVAALAGAFSSDSNGASGSASSASTSTATSPTPTVSTTGQPAAQPEVLGQIPLQAIGGAKAKGVAYLLRQGGQQVLAVTATLPPLPASQRTAAYNVWLYNSPTDAASIGAQFTNAKGQYQGVGPLPANFDKYKYIDVSRQPFNKQTGHSGDSLLRGQFSNLQPVPQGQAGAPSTGGSAPTGP